MNLCLQNEKFLHDSFDYLICSTLPYDMNVTPRELREEFKALLEEHKAKENEAHFIAKRAKVDDLKLEPKHSTNTMTEIFQDPDLLSRISREASRIMKDIPRPSRARRGDDLIICKKPQAKDVVAKRAISDDLAYLYDTLDQVVDKEKEFVNPLAPKERKYVAQEEEDRKLEEAVAAMQQTPLTNTTPIQSASTSIMGDSGQSLRSESRANSPSSAMNISSPDTAITLLTDSVFNDADNDMQWRFSLQENTVQQQPSQDSVPDEIKRLFDDAAYVMNTSPLKTVGSKHLYNLLPRQSESLSYVYVKEDTVLKTTDAQKKQWCSTSATQDTILTITIYQPNNSNAKLQQIEILGSQFLSEIRDSIYCQSDFKSNNDRINTDPEAEVLNSIDGQKLSPSFIYQNHTFYADTRHRATQSTGHYDGTIQQWLRKHRVNTDKFHYTTKSMQKARLEDIHLALQQPLAFVHQDNCEHKMVVEDVRLLSFDDDYSSTSSDGKKKFPRTTYNLKYNRFKCNMCSVYPADKVTYNDIYSGFSPCYFCTTCFEAFHPAKSKDDSYTVQEYYGTPGYKSAN